jgi:hypothetical protein
MTPRIRIPLAALVIAMGVAAGQVSADDGGSGTYAASGSSFQVALVNSGTTAWQFFTLTAPPGTTFAGGATQGESTARCTPGQPDGLPNELECGPLAVAPGARVGVVATVTGTAGCAAALHLAVSSTGIPPFSQATDVVPSSSCATNPSAQAGGGCSAAAEEAADAATVAELAAEEKAVSFNWSGASNLLARMRSSSAVKAARIAAARLNALAAAVAGRRTTAATTLAAAQAATTCQGAASTSCAGLKAAARAKTAVFDDAVRDIRQTGIAAASARLSHSPAAASFHVGAARLSAFLAKRPAAAPHC